MKVKTFLMTLLIVLSVATYALAAEGHDHHEHKGSMVEHMKEESSSPVEVGNKICPVSGEKVGMMGPVVQHEYKGEIYNFCCLGCIAEFKKNPEKYAEKAKETLKEGNVQ